MERDSLFGMAVHQMMGQASHTATLSRGAQQCHEIGKKSGALSCAIIIGKHYKASEVLRRGYGKTYGQVSNTIVCTARCVSLMDPPSTKKPQS